MLRIAIFDDEKYSREELVHQILTEIPNVEIAEGASGVEAIEILESGKFDILFVDIHLGDMSGTTIASLAKKLMPDAKVIFATAFSQYAVKAFELGVDNYILKPFDPKRVSQVLKLYSESAIKPTESTETIQKIAVTDNRRTVLLNAEDIAYIETSGSGRHCIIYTIDKRSYTTLTTLNEYETKLAPMGFFRIHKARIVRLKLIKDIFPWGNNSFALHLEGFTDTLPIARERTKSLRHKLSLG